MLPVHHLLLLLATLLMNSLEVSAGQEEPLVTAPAGTFRGKVLTSPSGVRYASYRGIPYALPPTGERRFAKPEPYPFIQGVRDASEFGSFCLQNMNGTAVGKEDCLFVNVFTPLARASTEKGRLKSVLVFIHAGGFVMGNSNIYIPGDLVTQTDIVVVTMNYRLGWLGFLHGSTDSLPGNQGFWDQLLSLHWVKDNIRAFGGDPDEITLAGCSAGSMSTSVWTISPLSKGLFKRAIFLSGTLFIFPTPPRTSNTILEMISRQLDCGIEDVTGNEEAVVKCLKQQPADKFYLKFNIPFFLELTTSGDEIMPKPILQLLDDSEYLSQVGFFDRDYILGVTNDDGYILVSSIFETINTTFLDATARDYAKMFMLPEQLAKFIVTEYKKLYQGQEKHVFDLITDEFFLKAVFKFVDVFEKNPSNEKKKKKTYLVSFDHAPEYIENGYMIHAFDIPYLFDMHPADIAESFYLFRVNDDFKEEDVKLKADFIDLVGSFIKYGNPNKNLKKKMKLEWQAYDSSQMNYLSFSLQPSMETDILRNRRYIWESLVPQWMRESSADQAKEEL